MNIKRFTFISDRQPTAEDANPQSYVLDENYAFIKWFKVTPEQAWYPLPTSSQSQEQKVKNLLDAIDQKQTERPVVIPYEIAHWILKVKEAREELR